MHVVETEHGFIRAFYASEIKKVFSHLKELNKIGIKYKHYFIE